jgi:uncharacterized protein (DUF1501 family)
MARLNRREWMKLASAGVVGWSMSGWLGALAARAAGDPERKRSAILLWMNGGPSQMDTWDLKPGHPNGGPFKETATSVPGVKISEHLPKLATHAHELAIIRSMSTKEGDHTRATHYLRTGYLPVGQIRYPTIGSLLSKELGDEGTALPNFVSIAPMTYISPAAYGPGFLGARHAPLMVGANQFGNANVDQALRVQDLQPDVTGKQADARLALLQGLQEDFAVHHRGVAAAGHRAAYERALRLMQTDAHKAFDLDEEKDAVRDAYGRNLFGQGCLLARRLVERGVPFVEVTLSQITGAQAGWDTHQNNFDQVKVLSGVLDAAWATLMGDLKERGLLDTTLIVWMGEFGRTPKINPNNGRDHFPTAWSAVLAGGGIKGGQVHGQTSKDGMEVKDNPVPVKDFLATACKAVGIDPTKQNMSNVGRPIRIADAGARPIEEVLS